MAVLWSWKWRRYLFNSSTGRGCIEHISANLLQPLPAFSAEEFLVLSHSCVQFPILSYPPSALLSVIPSEKSFRTKEMQSQQVALCTTNASWPKQNVWLSLPQKSYDVKFNEFSSLFLAICLIAFTTNDDIFCLCLR